MSEEVPERIWVKLNGTPKFYESPCDDMPLLKCYIRADIHEDRVKELEDVVKNLWRRQDSLDTFDAAVNAVLAPLFEKQLKENNTNE